jgi:ribosomal protein L11 methylase PrmA
MQNKLELITHFVKKVPRIKDLWDFGGNTGVMSRAIQAYAEHIICFDIDVAAVENNYLQVKDNAESKILPLVMDFTNPSPPIGFASKERSSLGSRGVADLGIALAFIHHLAISNNIPLSYIAKYFSSLCSNLIIEFIPKEDSQVQRLLLSRNDIFSEYNQDAFISAFSKYFEITDSKKVAESKRTIYLMKRPNRKAY